MEYTHFTKVVYTGKQYSKTTSKETKMTTCAPSSNCQNPSEEGSQAGKRVLFGSCIVCWGVVGVLVIVGLASMLLS
ncbi:MAG: hypothetical protein M0P95_05975 [Sulfuritalea sp.]|jgi:hypothetical protein|nr:hypothetical protein [Sulfuritalea sp.]